MSRVRYVGERTILESEYKDFDNNPVNVSSGIVVYILKPHTTNYEGPYGATRTEKGIYQYTYVPTTFGKHRYQFQDPSGNIVSESSFTVKRSIFDSLPPFPAVEGVPDGTPEITMEAVDPIPREALVTTPSMTMVAIDGQLVDVIGVGVTASTTYTEGGGDGYLQINAGDIFFVQNGDSSNSTVQGTGPFICCQTRTSYPDGPLNTDPATGNFLILDLDGLNLDVRYIRVDEENHKIVFSAQDTVETYKSYVYTCKFDGSDLTKIYTAPIDTTPGREYGIPGIQVNNRSDGTSTRRVIVSIDGTYGLVFKGYMVTMDIDGGNQSTVLGPVRNASELLISDRDNRLMWDADDFGFNNYTIEPTISYICDSHASSQPLNSLTGGWNGRDNYVYNIDGFGIIKRAESGDGCNPSLPFTTWRASHPSPASFEDITYSDLTEEIIVSGLGGRNYNVDDSSDYGEIGHTDAMGSIEYFHMNSGVVFQGGQYQV